MDGSSNPRNGLREPWTEASISSPGVRRQGVDKRLLDLVSQPGTACVPPSPEKWQQIASKSPGAVNPVSRSCTKTSAMAKTCLSCDALETKAAQTEASAKLQNTRHEEFGVACLFWQPHRSLYSTFTEIEEDTHASAERARQLQGDNAWMSTSPSESRNGQLQRERKDGPVEHLRTFAKQRVLVRQTVVDQKRYVFASKNGRSNPGRRLPHGRSSCMKSDE